MTRDSFSEETDLKKKLEIKVINKVKESNLKIVNGEWKQYRRRGK